jgi:hypothetical protein
MVGPSHRAGRQRCGHPATMGGRRQAHACGEPPARFRRDLHGLAPVAPVAAVDFVLGSAGLGDPFFPSAGNGGYDVTHYALTLSYEPSTNQLTPQ